MRKYPYKYIHHDEAAITSVGHWMAGTEISARKQIIFEMIQYYRQAHKMDPFASLAEKGIQVDCHYGGWRIIISHPSFFIASKEEVQSFPHWEIAKEITMLWRKRRK